MRKAQSKAPSRPGSGALEVINFGTMTTGDSTLPGSSQLAAQESSSGRLSAPGTPKKTVNLVAVKRKEAPSSEDSTAMARLALADPTSAEAMCSIATDTSFRATAAIRIQDSDKHSTGSHRGDGDNDSGSSSSSSSGDDSDSDEDLTKAPNEMKLEFLDCIMKKDYQTAAKLCRMILIYEPSNPDALRFQTVIQQKIEQDASRGSDEGSGSSSGEESSSDGDGDSNSGSDTNEDDGKSSDEDGKEKGDSDDSNTDDDEEDDDEEDDDEGSTSDEESGDLASSGPAKCNSLDYSRR